MLSVYLPSCLRSPLRETSGSWSAEAEISNVTYAHLMEAVDLEDVEEWNTGASRGVTPVLEWDIQGLGHPRLSLRFF